MKQVITATDVATARKAGQATLAVPDGAIITPQAADDAREFGITLVRENGAPVAAGPMVPVYHAAAMQPRFMQPQVMQPQTMQPQAAQTPVIGYGPHVVPVPMAPLPLNAVQAGPVMPRILTQNIPQGVPPMPAQAYAPYPSPAQPAPSQSASANDVVDEVRRLVMARLGNAVPPALDAVISSVLSGAPGQGGGPVVFASASSLPASNVASAPAAVSMVEVAAPSASLPGLGYLSWENSSFTWTFDTAEALAVLEGQLSLTANGSAYTAGPGDSFLIPAGVAVTLSAKGRVRCVHSSWPNPETAKG